MSKTYNTIDFNDLKFNLYDILGLQPDTTEEKIKKSFKKLVLELHPDKNPESNDEIYNHVIMANQILSNKNARKDYDNFLDNKNKKTSHIDLKNEYENAMSNIDSYFPKKEEATDKFKSKIEELNKKHGVVSENNTMKQYNEIKKSRDSGITIPQEKISSNADFNKKFETKKEHFFVDNNVLIPNDNTNLETYQPNDVLTTIGDYSKLYSDGSVSTGTYTSLDLAFKIQKITPFQEKSVKERMEDYNNSININKKTVSSQDLRLKERTQDNRNSININRKN